MYAGDKSPSSRRAWIEIEATQRARWTFGVALLAEGVDRNLMVLEPLVSKSWSPSSRRAWIEIYEVSSRLVFKLVALLAEGVDRNVSNRKIYMCSTRSPSSRRAWIEIGSSPAADL